MADESKTSRKPRSRAVLWVFLALAIVIPIAVFAFWRSTSGVPSGVSDMTGLDGEWREDQNPKLVYRLRSDGKLESKSEGLPLGGLAFGEFGSWKRVGRKITILPDRDWRMDGELEDDGTIRGKMTSISGGNVLGDVVWRRK